MGSKREEERNEKIIRGLMKLPPNRRCINCNSLGPQYVCTNFWTFVCMPCSGIHREFTHRVKSVSMAKFTSQEVDALQKGGNQRARELFLNAWDPLRHKHPDNSNPDKVREFIRNVYVNKKYAVDQSSDRPPKDPQSIRSREDEMRRASSYHSYSQSPPYDFQYEERRYGKPVASLTRKHGSDRGLYDGRLSSLLSPSRFSDHTNDERLANEGSFPRVSDYSVSSGGDPLRSDILSPSPQRGAWSPFNETSSNFSSEINHTNPHLDANAGRISRPQRTVSSGSFGSFDSMSFKCVNSTGLLDFATEAKQPVGTSPDATLSFPSPPQSSTSTTFNGLDLFNEPFAPQNFTATPATVCSSQSPESLLAQSVQQSPISSVPSLVMRQPAQTLQPGLSQQRPVASLNNMPHNGGWAAFDPSQNLTPMASQNSVPAPLPFSAGNNLGDFNQFSLDQSAFSQKSTSHEPSASTHTLWHGGLQNVEPTNNTQLWNAFEDPPQKQPIEYVLKDNQAAVQNTTRSFDLTYEALNYVGNLNNTYEIEPPPSSLSSHSNMALHDFSMVPEMAGVPPVLNVRSNPFDLPCDADLGSNDMTQFWDMSSLQAALPNSHIPATYIGDANESWFPQNSVPPYIPGGITFDPPNGSLGFIVAQAPSPQISSIPAQGPVASVGGNPFA